MSSQRKPGFSRFYASVPDSIQRALRVLSAPVSLTDEVARNLLERFAGERFPAREMVAAIRKADFVIDRNSEWQLTTSVRRTLLEELSGDETLNTEVNEALVAVAESASADQAGDTVPTYLVTPLGAAYHAVAAGRESMEALARIFPSAAGGLQWLIGELATEQRDLGRIPGDCILPTFLSGMAAYREGRVRDATRDLRVVAQCEEETREVAIACHVLGYIIGAKNSQEAEKLLRRGLSIGESLGDLETQGQILHTLGNLLLVGDRNEAVRLLRLSLDAIQGAGDRLGEAMVANSLANSLGREQLQEAEDLVRSGLEAARSVGNPFAEAQALHTLGNLIAQKDPQEAMSLLLRSLEIGERLGHLHHQGQVANSLGNLNLWQLADFQAASDWYNRSISVSKHPRDLAVAHLGLSRIAESMGDLASAIEHMHEAISNQERSDAPQYVRTHRRRLAGLEERMRESSEATD